ncbi:uncharacterized protein KY384_004268 [Bacidia gigantensis]|uniref:uncharacterized protein n=1 Tax=Bacidia gigantensis TaxID=2732470 RepID=UPI001D047015|nr:uncharacterized protein KY384_004268 [Bacidia gigantensis]KAG8530911.1 hypothetical protein KY384_004268 [Bacidia gigantensis]
MPLTVLSDADIHALLISLSKEDIERLQSNLCDAMHDYSKGSQETCAGCSGNQPKRMMIPGPNKQTTLFMPAATNTSKGVKIISLASPPNATKTPSLASLDLNSSFDSRNSSPAPQSPSRASSISTNASLSHTTSNTSTKSNTPYTPSSSITSPASTNPSLTSSQSTTPRGSLTLLDSFGNPYAFLAAEELTAFRTALGSTVILTKREKVHSITVFGAGMQARWHIRLALLLKGPHIHHVDIINRSFARAKAIMHDFYTSDEWADIRERNPKVQFSILSSEFKDRHQHLKDHVRKADAIFLTTPSTEPLFPAEILTHAEGRKKGRYIAAIGSYRSHMVELHPDILQQAVAVDHKHHHHRHADEGRVIIVDSLEECLKGAGEVVQAGITPKQLVEVGELMMVKKASMREIEMGGEGEKGLKNWLIKGNVIYKSVGLGLMDICVGEDVVGIARERGLGTHIEGF